MKTISQMASTALAGTVALISLGDGCMAATVPVEPEVIVAHVGTLDLDSDLGDFAEGRFTVEGGFFETSGLPLSDGSEIYIGSSTTFSLRTVSGEQAASMNDLEVGDRVRIVTTGVERRSYPPEYDAVAVTIIRNGD